MHVIGHEHVGMHLALAVVCSISQCVQVKSVVLGLKKHRLSIHAARDDMLWNMRDKVSWLARHRRILGCEDSSGRCANMRLDPIYSPAIVDH